MVVAVVPVGAVQVPSDQVVDVITVRHRGMAAVRAVYVLGGMAVTHVLRRTRCWVRGINSDPAFVDVVAVDHMEVAVVKIVDVPAVLDRGVAARRAVDVIVLGVNWVVAHWTSS